MNIFTVIKQYLLAILVFLFPLFFLPLSQEFFVTQKLYLLAFGALALLLCSLFELLIERKIVWHPKSVDAAVLLFVLSTALSTLFSSPNKIQALLNPTYGFVAILSLGILYFYISRQPKHTNYHLLSVLGVSLLISSVVSVIFFFQPFKTVNLPQYFAFLKNPSFNTVGDQFTFVVFLLACSLMTGYGLFKGREHGKNTTLNAISFALFLTALALSVFSIANATNNFANLVLPPYRLSWYAAVDTLKNPLTAAFGVGVDNYASILTRVKDVIYNQSPIWQISSFTVARSALLHIFTETGLFGLLSFLFIVFTVFKAKARSYVPHFIVVFLISVIFPPSLALFFLVFLILGLVAHEEHSDKQEVELAHMPIVYIVLIIFGLGVIGSLNFLLARSYIAEYHHKRALDGLNGEKGVNVYEEERAALRINNSMERYHLAFSNINMILANNVAKKDPKKISADDRQIIAQAIQAAIAEAKTAVALNPLKATNWENLAVIYKNILTAVKGADVWTIVAYQRAIVNDPQNPSYRVGLGGVYYSLNNYDEAKRMFEQAVSLKPDWPNAYYNLAWASYQKGDYQLAANAMQNVLNFLDKEKNGQDYKKAQKDLEDFKKKIPQEDLESTESADTNSQLQLSPQTEDLDPKIELPEPQEASPEAN